MKWRGNEGLMRIGQIVSYVVIGPGYGLETCICGLSVMVHSRASSYTVCPHELVYSSSTSYSFIYTSIHQHHEL